MDEDKARLIIRYFIMLQFSYCPLIWMFRDRATNSHDKENYIHHVEKIFLLKKQTHATL